jgi:2-amino-4-hydroxy-6-hydroxymethyldihydropteridine diphosphokinase
MGESRDRDGCAEEGGYREPGRSLRGTDGAIVRVFLGLGSNLGDRIGFLRRGLQALARGGLLIERVSSVVETPAVGYEDQPPFLNLVAGGGWKGGPDDLLALMGRTEVEAGRTRPFPDAPRTLDVDLIFFGTLIIRRPELRVPHLRWKERSFVARPLQQVAPELVDPETGLTVNEICRCWPQEPEEVDEVLAMQDFSWKGP